MLLYASLLGFENLDVLTSAAPKICKVSSRADREIWKFGSSGGSSSSSKDSGITQWNVVKRALSRKTIPGLLAVFHSMENNSMYLA